MITKFAATAALALMFLSAPAFAGCITKEDQIKGYSVYPDVSSVVFEGDKAKKLLAAINTKPLPWEGEDFEGDVIVVHTRTTHPLAMVDGFKNGCGVKTLSVPKKFINDKIQEALQ